MKPDEKLKKEVKARFGQEMIEDNPFVTSEDFLGLIKGAAMIPKCIIMASRGPSEFVNGLLSVIVTMLNNIPDKIWNSLMTASQDPEFKDDGTGRLHPREALDHLNALRGYMGNAIRVHEDGKNALPDFTVKPPQHTQ